MKPNDIQYLYKAIRISAAESVLDPDDTYFFRKICRWYSKTFNEPLSKVLKLDPEHILTHYYEATMEEMPYNDLYDVVIEEFIPELAEQQDQEAEAYAKALEEEQARTLAKKGILAKPTQPKNLNKQQSLTHKANSDQSSQPEEINLTFDDEDPEDA